jgi:L-histidine N-alpha-methyltransferase
MKSAFDFSSLRFEIRNHLENSFRSDIRRDIFKGMTAKNKFIPSKYFYDARGSHLFEKICVLPEYYQTRTEMSILHDVAQEIIDPFPGGDIVELGSGANHKIRVIFDAADREKLPGLRYVPVDVSDAALISAAEELLEIYPGLEVLGIIADFTRHIDVIPNEKAKLIFFFGSTIGNFSEEACADFLRSVSVSMKPEDRFITGLDMLKPKTALEAAYNDSSGVTSQFNKNILTVINRELHANFDRSHFDHCAFFNGEKERMEMHLRANRRVSVEIADLELQVDFGKGETIHTEICRKFSRPMAEQMASDAGLVIDQWFSDKKEWFSLVEFRKNN